MRASTFLASLACSVAYSAAIIFTAPAAQAAAKDYVILQIDDDKVKASEVSEIWEGLFPKGQAPKFDGFKENVRQNVLRGVVSEHLIYKQAVASKIADSAEVKEQLALLKKKLITQAFLEKKAKDAVSKSALQKAYDEEAAKLKGKQEVSARHVLVESEEKAKEVLKKLEDGAKFEDVAKEMSADKGSAVRGGDLGFFTEDRMVPAFSKAAFAMKKGEISAPVKSDFGWHVIKVEDKRDVKAPSFEESKEGLEQKVRGEALKNYVNELVDTANVKYFDAAGKEQELTRTPDESK